MAYSTIGDAVPLTEVELERRLAEIDAQGYTLIEGVIDARLIAALTDTVDRLLVELDVPYGENTFLGLHTRRIFNLDADMDSAVYHLGGDPLLGDLVRQRPGIRVPGAWDPFEIGVRGIIGQQVTVAGANTLIARLVARHGQPVPGLADLGLTHVFPSASTLADADLDGLGLVRARAQAIRSFARAVVDDSVRLDRSADLDHLAARSRPVDRALHRVAAR